MRHILTISCLFVAGCAGSMDRISDMRETAPDWYEARKQEFAGRGYPELANVPSDSTYGSQQAGLVKTAGEREAIRQAFFSNPRSEPAYLTPEEIRAWGLELKRRFSAEMKPADYLTDADVARLRARFDRPRARR